MFANAVPIHGEMVGHHGQALTDSQGWFALALTPGPGIELNEDMLERTLSKTATFH
jgi:hypothetical protein